MSASAASHQGISHSWQAWTRPFSWSLVVASTTKETKGSQLMLADHCLMKRLSMSWDKSGANSMQKLGLAGVQTMVLSAQNGCVTKAQSSKCFASKYSVAILEVKRSFCSSAKGYCSIAGFGFRVWKAWMSSALLFSSMTCHATAALAHPKYSSNVCASPCFLLRDNVLSRSSASAIKLNSLPKTD